MGRGLKSVVLNRMKSRMTLFLPAFCFAAGLFGMLLLPFPVVANDIADIDVNSSPLVYEEVRQTYETRVAHQVQALLEKVVGSGHVSVSVRADLNFNQNSVNNEVIDPDMPVVASSKINGAQEETVYAFSKRVTRQIQKGGFVSKMSVAVLVDSSVPPTVLPRLQALVQTAVGFDAARGDQIEIMTASFKESAWQTALNGPLVRVLEFAFLILALLAAIVFILYKSFRPVPHVSAPMPDFAQPEKTARMRAASSQETPDDAVPILKQVHDRINQNPQDAVTVIRSWLYQGGEEVSDG